jgi:hypothetical protein
MDFMKCGMSVNVLVVSGVNRPTSRELGVGGWELADSNHSNFMVLSDNHYWLAAERAPRAANAC